MLCQSIRKITIPTSVLQNISLHDKNWFGTGGAASFFSQPTNASDFSEALQFAHQNQLSTFLLGQGANILISDEGFQGLVIAPKMRKITAEELSNQEVLVYAESGVTMHELITWCLSHNIIGLEEFSGIPGTVGGSVYINLHYFEFLLSQFLRSAQVINKETGTILDVDNAWFDFGYDTSRLHAGDYYLLNATFKLKKVTAHEIAYATGRHHEIIRHRARRYPVKKTCGSFFRNFYDHEVSVMSNNKKMIYAAYYLDKLGIKGELSVGDAAVSHQHANMIVNRGKATSHDIISLARVMQSMVYDRFQIMLQPECQLIGFKTYPLLS